MIIEAVYRRFVTKKAPRCHFKKTLKPLGDGLWFIL